MIEVLILNHILENSEIPAFMEVPLNPPLEYYLLEKTSGNQNDKLYSSTFAIQSIAQTMARAAQLNADLRPIMDTAITIDEICRVRLNSDYNYTDTTKKQYRYQAVYDIVHY